MDRELTPFAGGIQRANVTVAKLAIFFGGLPDGALIRWVDIAAACEVPMDYAGRALARRGVKMARREYITHKGLGIELSSPQNALAIVGGRLHKVSAAVRRADRSQAALSARHLDAMSPVDRQRMLQVAGFLGAVRAMAQEVEVKVIVQQDAAALGMPTPDNA